jgi:DNA-binding NarL/FixJ family response regulator
MMVSESTIGPSGGPSGGRTPTRHDVVIVEPFSVVRAGIGLIVEASPGLTVAGTSASAEEAIPLIDRLDRTQLVVLVSMGLAGESDAYWLIRALRERFPGLIILGLGANADPNTVSRALFTGADGFIDKNAEVEEFLEAIREASEAEVVIAGPAADSVGTIAEGIERRRSQTFRLTRREREVLAVAAEGLTAREIADRLGVRERTVTTHLARIYGKLGVGNRLAALRLAARSGLLTLPPAE